MRRFCIALFVVGMTAALFGAADPDKVAAVEKGEIKEAKASWWGYDPIDSTAALQAAFDSKAERIIVDKQASPWIVEPVFVRPGKEIVFEEGAELQAKKGAFKDLFACMLNVVNADGVTIRGLGKGGILRMHKKDYQDRQQYKLGEWRHCLNVKESKNFRVENMDILSSGGDGVYLGIVNNAIVRNVRCDDNHRQGISIIGGHNILVEDSEFNRTKGTSPHSGLDIEPNNPNEPLSGIVVRNCKFIGNFRWGILIAATRQNSDRGGPMDIRFENCVAENNREGDIYAYTRTEFKTGDPIRGKVEFLNCSAVNTSGEQPFPRPAVEVDLDLHHELEVTFRNLIVRRGTNPAKAIQIDFNHPLSAGSVPKGKIRFINTKLEDAPLAEALQINDYSFSGTSNWIEGDLTDKDGQRATIDKAFLTASGHQTQPEYGFAPVKGPFFAESSGKMETYPEFSQILSADYWLLAKSEESVEFTLKYTKNGRWSRDAASVTLVTPDGGRMELGTIAPASEKKFAFTAGAAGIYRVEVRGFYLKTALIASTAPAGPIAKDFENELDRVTGDLYVYVPAGAPRFAVRLWARGWLNSFGVTITDPSGKVVLHDPLVIGSGIQYNAPAAAAEQGGIWKLTIARPRRFWYDRGFFRIMGASPYLGLRPDRVPVVK